MWRRSLIHYKRAVKTAIVSNLVPQFVTPINLETQEDIKLKTIA